MRILLTLLIFLFKTFSAKACDCDDDVTIKDDINDATAIFSGQVVSITPYTTLQPGIQDSDVVYRAVAVKLQVKNQWKGQPVKEITIITGTMGMQGDDCAYIFKKGKNYLVFAFANDRSGVFSRDSSPYLFSDKDLFTDCCSFTDELSHAKKLGHVNQLHKFTDMK